MSYNTISVKLYILKIPHLTAIGQIFNSKSCLKEKAQSYTTKIKIFYFSQNCINKLKNCIIVDEYSHELFIKNIRHNFKNQIEYISKIKEKI